jgi:uncharacterized protein (TIGR00369 family)
MLDREHLWILPNSGQLPAGSGILRIMSAFADEVRKLLAATNPPACVALTPYQLLDADAEQARARVEFAPQPAFGNHFGNIQGGFLVAMLEVPLTIAVFIKTRRFLPTIEIKTSFVSPAKIGVCIAEGVVVRAGSSVVFAEARLWSPDGKLAAHATATSLAAGA